MSRHRSYFLLPSLGLFTSTVVLACSQVIGLDQLSVDKSVKSTGGTAGTATGVGTLGGATSSSGGSANVSNAGTSSLSMAGASGTNTATCKSNSECTDLATKAYQDSIAAAGAPGNPSSSPSTVPAICQKSTGQCVTLLSQDCDLVTGDYLNDRAIVIGSLFQTQGSTATQNIPRQQSATLAVEEINAVGGIPSSTAGVSHPLVMVSCNSSVDLVRAATHLVSNVQVPAIVGPNTSQDTLDVSSKVTIQAGVAVLSPTAVAASIADLRDNDLTWLMIPSDDQRADLMRRQINDLESELKTGRSRTSIKLSIIYRNDALGIGTRTSLDKLVLNGKPLSDPTNAGIGGNVHIVPYDYKQADQSAIVTKEADFAPDIVVLAGTAESITKVLTPLELQWNKTSPGPYYLIIDPSKGPELLAAVKGNDDLRRRVRGTGTKSTAEADPVNNAFNVDYMVRYGTAPTASGCGASYDATYAIAYALAATKDSTPSGATVATGLRMLAGGTTSVTTGTQDLLAAFQNLASGRNVSALGTACPLDWDANGTVKHGTIEMWCIGKTAAGDPLFKSSGLILNIGDSTPTGAYTQCE